MTSAADLLQQNCSEHGRTGCETTSINAYIVGEEVFLSLSKIPWKLSERIATSILKEMLKKLM